MNNQWGSRRYYAVDGLDASSQMPPEDVRGRTEKISGWPPRRRYAHLNILSGLFWTPVSPGSDQPRGVRRPLVTGQPEEYT